MNITVTPTQDSLVTSSHTSEGVLLKKADGNIIHFYRHDPGIAGDHTSNTGQIYKREFNIVSEVWSSPSLFYDSVYDNRNAQGGVLASGRMVLFFLKYQWSGAGNIAIMMSYSDDDGDTWTTPTAVTIATSGSTPYGDIIDIYDNPDQSKRYMKPFIASYKLFALFSEDGSTWGDETTIADYSGPHTYYTNEASYAYIGGGKIVGIVRDQDYTASGSNYYQVTSSDYGATWTAPVRTNINSPHFSPAPSVIFRNGKLIVVGADRRSLSTTGNIAYEGIWIWSGEPNIVFTDPTKYKPKVFVPRPKTSSDRAIYGYQSIAPIDDNRYLVVFTDKDTDTDTTEDADFYQFYMDVDSDTPVEGQSYPFPAFNNNDTYR